MARAPYMYRNPSSVVETITRCHGCGRHWRCWKAFSYQRCLHVSFQCQLSGGRSRSTMKSNNKWRVSSGQTVAIFICSQGELLFWNSRQASHIHSCVGKVICGRLGFWLSVELTVQLLVQSVATLCPEWLGHVVLLSVSDRWSFTLLIIMIVT